MAKPHTPSDSEAAALLAAVLARLSPGDTLPTHDEVAAAVAAECAAESPAATLPERCCAKCTAFRRIDEQIGHCIANPPTPISSTGKVSSSFYPVLFADKLGCRDKFVAVTEKEATE